MSKKRTESEIVGFKNAGRRGDWWLLRRTWLHTEPADVHPLGNRHTRRAAASKGKYSLIAHHEWRETVAALRSMAPEEIA